LIAQHKIKVRNGGLRKTGFGCVTAALEFLSPWDEDLTNTVGCEN